MQRWYLQYRLTVETPLVMSDGSQMGNLLKTHDHIPGSSILGHCAALYLRHSSACSGDGCYTGEFRDLFLSSKTLFSPAYPIVGDIHRTFPMPLSVFGCKHFGSRDPAALTNPVKRKDQHGFDDFLYPPVPPICKEPDCGSPSDHKAGFCYLHPRFGYCDADVSRSIIPHNEFAENPKDKNVYFYEALAEGQLFYGEIAFSSQSHCELMDRLLRANPHARMGKAKYRGHGNVLFHTPIQRDQSLLNDWKLKGWRGPGPCFSIYLFSDAILVDESLNYRTGLDEKDLARWLKLPNTEGFRVHIRLGQQSHLKSFFKTGTTMGFNQHRGMPLPMEVVVTRGSVFTATYEGDIDIRGALESLEREGIGLRRNEGYGRILIDHAIHGQPREVSS